MIKKVSKKFVSTLHDVLVENFSARKEDVIEILMDEYNLELGSAVTDRKSRTNPGLPKYVDAYREALEEYEMVVTDGMKVKFSVPDMEKFNFNNSALRVIQNILEGTSGTYVEVDAEQYEQMYGKRPVGLQAFDDTARKKDIVYVMRYTSELRRREFDAFRRRELVRYPFSNTPPIDIFSAGDRYVEDNIRDWIHDSVKKSMKMLERGM